MGDTLCVRHKERFDMRLLVDCHCFDDGEVQGINTYIRELYKALIPIAKEITFVFAARDTDRIRNLFGMHPNVEYAALGQHGKYYRLAVEYPRIIKDWRIDWAHFQYTSPLVKNCKTIVTLHDILFEDYPGEFPLSYRVSKRLLFKTSATRADMLLTVSDYSRQRIARHYGIPERDIYVTYNGVSPDFSHLDRTKAMAEKGKMFGKYILYVSRMEPRKNQQALIRAYRNLGLHKKGYDLVLIGVRSLACEELDREMEMCDDETRRHIHFLQGIPYRELQEWYAGASLFVYPSKAEGFGIPPLEAAACGVPVICNNQTAMKDFTFFGDRHIEAEDQALLESMITETLEKTPSEGELDKTRADIYRRYSWANIAAGFYAKLKERF